MHPSRAAAIAHATAALDDGRFEAALRRRVALPTESQRPDAHPVLRRYLTDELHPSLVSLGFHVEVHDHVHDDGPAAPPFLIAHRREGDHLPTVLTYLHGDVVDGMATQWADDRQPWQLARQDDRWYGRGTADNKGQHTINLLALEAVLQTRGHLGCNVVVLAEMGEEVGSPGLAEFAAAHRHELAADVFIASDGPRQAPGSPTIFLGSRGVLDVELSVHPRDGLHHSGNWGGALSNPATVLAAAIASLVDAHGVIQVEGLRPPPIPPTVRDALLGLEVGDAPGDPAVDEWWGEPGLTPIERVVAWNTLEVLAMTAGRPERPVNAIPDRAWARLHMRFVVGTAVGDTRRAIEQHLAAHGIVGVEVSDPVIAPATRLDPQHPWARRVAASLEATAGAPPVVLPNLGGTLPNDVFADVLGLPTVWIPHSYAGCRQHAADEHLLEPVVRSALAVMAGLFWDLGDGAPPPGDA